MNTIFDVIPNEDWELAIGFSNGEYRLLNLSIPKKEYGWEELANPLLMKRYTFNRTAIDWEFGGTLDAEYLYRNSVSVNMPDLARHSVRVCYKNQAPTTKDERHHVYCVYLYPFSEKVFAVGESIGGGHGDRGGFSLFTLNELLTWEEWKLHFELSGCSWAIEMVEMSENIDQLVRLLVSEACKRNGA